MILYYRRPPKHQPASATMSCTSSDDHVLFDLENNNTVKFIDALYSFKTLYGKFHRYIAVLLCVIGLIANCLHICVLTRRQMRRSAVHTVLTVIAFADMGTMTSYLIYITRFEFFMQEEGYPYSWAGFLKIHAVLSIALHAISIYLVVFMAFIRFLAMDAGHRKWMMPQPAIIISTIVAAAIFILCIPTFLAHQIYERSDTLIKQLHTNQSIELKYSIGFSTNFEANNCQLFKWNLWLTGIVLKAIPCFLLLTFTFALLKKLHENEMKRRILLKTPINGGEKPRRITTDRTTTMLLLMVFVFLITELPQGIFAILNAIYTSQFHGYVYMSFADLLDLLSLINCYVGFLVYSITSSKYRQTLLMMLPICQSEYRTVGSTKERTNTNPRMHHPDDITISTKIALSKNQSIATV